MENESRSISARYPYKSNYIGIMGSQMHYIDEGSGDPILFLHGNPTSSYLWRNVIPYLSKYGRCIAPDLIGMGKSDKPAIPYRFHDHSDHLESFIDALGLKNITLVIHDWGSALGFHYARRNPDNIKGLAFMEAILGPANWADFPGEFKMMFKLLRAPFIGWMMISGMNMFVEKILPKSIVRKLTKEEMDNYRQPYKSISSRKPIRQWPREIPIDGKPEDVHKDISYYKTWLEKTDLPKILFYAHPGALITRKGRTWCEENLSNLTMIDIGKGLHFIQEDNPHMIGEELAKWYLASL